MRKTSPTVIDNRRDRLVLGGTILLDALAAAACSAGTTGGASDCSATVNRCPDQCNGQPEALNARNCAIDANGRGVVRSGACESSCYRYCK
jgi:hypothetical protein